MEQFLKSKYRVGKKLAETPFSITYQGFFIGTDKPLIVKIYKRGTLNSALINSMKRRVREFSLINHPNIAKIIDGDYGWQGFYYVREFIEGKSVRELLDRGEKIGVEKACIIADQVLTALEEVHVRGIIHGALKPSNIYIDDQGLVKVCDFVIEGEVKESLPQKVLEIIEDAQYASPEELEGAAATPASDLFSLGLILYEMATGKTAIAESGIKGNIVKVKSSCFLSGENLSGLPHYLAEIIVRAVQKDPLLRFGSAADFRESLAKKGVILKPVAAGEFIKIFEETVTQYGGEEIDRNSEALQDVGRVRIRWSKEKHRNWILSVIVGVAVVLGILYAFFFGR